METINGILCPKCGSNQLTTSKKGFSGKKAVAGAVLTGGIGLLAGTIGSNKIKITCLACGHQFNPGQGAKSEADFKKKNAKAGCMVMLVAIFAVTAMFIKCGTSLTPEEQKQMDKQVDSTMKAMTLQDSIAKINKGEKELGDLKDQLKRENNSFDKPFDASAYRGSVESIQMEIVLFMAWGDIIGKGENNPDKEINKLASILKKKVVARQAAEFPKMRKEYGAVVGQILWAQDIYVTTQGESNGIINLTGGLFASNQNIQDTQTTLRAVLTQFRFKEVRYRWYKGADEFTYYKLDTPKDNELVIH